MTEQDLRYCGGALWRLPSGLIVQLVMLDREAGEVTWCLNCAGTACHERDGRWQYRSSELSARLAGGIFLGQDDGRWLWDAYADLVRESVPGGRRG